MPGEHVVITGRSGTGKSTIIKLLLGILEPDEGHILVVGSEGNLGLCHSCSLPFLYPHSLEYKIQKNSALDVDFRIFMPYDYMERRKLSAFGKKQRTCVWTIKF
jgi:energy-coupling factor transporter ATP-binding protein EcfA2